jgi:Tol biopolymer transport system component
LTFRRGAISSARFGPGGRVVYTASWDGGGPSLYESDGVSADARKIELDGDKVVAVSSRGEVAYLNEATLTRAPLLGGSPKDLLKGVLTADQTPDGSEAAIARYSETRTRIEFPIGRVLCDAAGPSHLRVSPDARWVAFLEHPLLGDDRGSVVVVDREGHRRTLSEGWSSIEGLSWRPDSAEIWFTAARVGADNALHAVTLEGRERAVAPGVGRLVLQDIAPDGKVLMVRDDARAEIRYVDLRSGSERNLSWQDYSSLRDFSRDGRTALFEESGQAGGEGYSVFVRGIDRSPAVRIGHGVGRALSPDGKWALTVPILEPDRIEIVPVGEGEGRVVQNPGIDRYDAAQWLPDGKGFVFSGADREGRPRVYVQGFESGSTPRPLTPVGEMTWAHMLSPDGRSLLATCAKHYCIYPVDAPGSPRTVPALDKHRPLCWGDSGRTVYVTQRARTFREVLKLDVATGQVSPWRTITPSDEAGFDGVFNFLAAPDDHGYGYSYRRVISELYLVSNLS